MWEWKVIGQAVGQRAASARLPRVGCRSGSLRAAQRPFGFVLATIVAARHHQPASGALVCSQRNAGRWQWRRPRTANTNTPPRFPFHTYRNPARVASARAGAPASRSEPGRNLAATGVPAASRVWWGADHWWSRQVHSPRSSMGSPVMRARQAEKSAGYGLLMVDLKY